jgi:hypothetical protein
MLSNLAQFGWNFAASMIHRQEDRRVWARLQTTVIGMMALAALEQTQTVESVNAEAGEPDAFDEGKLFYTSMAIVGGLAFLGLCNVVKVVMTMIKRILGRQLKPQEVEQHDAHDDVHQAVDGPRSSKRFIGITAANMNIQTGRRPVLHKKMHMLKTCSQLQDALAFVEIDVAESDDGICKTCAPRRA